jgi:hypothetical protein
MSLHHTLTVLLALGAWMLIGVSKCLTFSLSIARRGSRAQINVRPVFGFLGYLSLPLAV